MDIRCRDWAGRQFLVEMQLIWTEHFQRRVLFNACKAYSQQIKKGDNYILRAPVYSLNIINDNFSNQKPVWYHHYRMANQWLPSVFMQGVEFVFIELPYFMPGKLGEKKRNSLWLCFLREIENKTNMVPQELLEVPEIAETVEALKGNRYRLEGLEQFEKGWDIVPTQKTMLFDATNKAKL